MALHFSSSLIPHFTQTIFEECDPELAKQAIPANLKLLEGLLRNDPENKAILTALSMGFTGYSMLFVEADDPERASTLYMRAKDYGIRALGKRGKSLADMSLGREDFLDLLNTMGKEDLEALVWTTVAWNAWINLNLDMPAALAQLNISHACLERVMEIDADYFHGLPSVLMGVSQAARPPMLGGKIDRAKECFENALKVSNGKFFLAQYYFARYYAVRVQDKDLFFRLLQEVVDGDADGLRDVCLMNTVIQQKAGHLKKISDELFF